MDESDFSNRIMPSPEVVKMVFSICNAGEKSIEILVGHFRLRSSSACPIRRAFSTNFPLFFSRVLLSSFLVGGQTARPDSPIQPMKQ